MGVFERLVDRGLVPADLLAGQFRGRVLTLARQLREGGLTGIARRSDEHLAQVAEGPLVAAKPGVLHPEGPLPPAFFAHLLGPAMLTGPWFADGDDLRPATAEQTALEFIVTRAGLVDGDRVLDLGGGLGAVALHAAARFRECLVVTRCANAHLAAHVTRQAKQRGLLNLQVVVSPLSKFRPEERFDRILAIEGTQRWLDHRRLLQRFETWLEPGGSLLLQLPTHADVPHVLPLPPLDWLGEHMVPTWHLTTLEVLAQHLEGLRLQSWWHLPGTYFARTLQAHLEHLNNRQVAIDEQLRKAFGPEAPTWRRRWEAAMLALQELHMTASGMEWGHHQVLLER